VFVLDRGYLNAPAIYSLGMLASLVAMLYFRSKNKFKISDQQEYHNNFKKMKNNGLNAIHLSAFLIAVSCYVIFWNTFPDSIAVFNPFKQKLGLRGVDFIKAHGMFCMSYIVVIVLVYNSIHFTGPRS
jgi:hypothetical protein